MEKIALLNEQLKQNGHSIMIIGKYDTYQPLESNLVDKIASLNGIEKVHGFTQLKNDQFLYLKEILEKQQKPDAKPILIRFMDCLDDKNSNNSYVKQVILNGRHLNIFSIVTMQYAVPLAPEICTNFDFVFARKEPSPSLAKKLYKSYFGFIPKFEEFNNVIKNLTHDEFLYTYVHSKDNYFATLDDEALILC